MCRGIEPGGRARAVARSGRTAMSAKERMVDGELMSKASGGL